MQTDGELAHALSSRLNEAYQTLVREAFLGGRSPYDFPEEHYEATWANRFSVDQLNAIGRRGLGLTS